MLLRKLKLFRTSVRGIYYFVVLVSLLVFIIASLARWRQVSGETENRLRANHQVMHYSFEDRLAQQTAMLRLLGERIVEKGVAKGHTAQAEKILDQMLMTNPVFVGYGLADPDGNLFIVSRNLRGKKLPNLKQDPRAAPSFRSALKRNGITLGQTYYFQPVKKWIIPLRFAIRDSSGRVLAVMTTGIDLDSVFSPWRSGAGETGLVICILKQGFSADEILYQYTNQARTKKEKEYYYGKRFPAGEFPGFFSKTLNKSNPAEDFPPKEIADPAADKKFTWHHKQLKNEIISIGHLHPGLGLFTVIGLPREQFANSFLTGFIPYLLVFLVFNIGQFFFLRYVDKKIYRSLRQKTILIQELYHRTMNNLQRISAMLNLQSHHGNLPAVAARHLTRAAWRVESIALVHKHLYHSPDISHLSAARYIRELAETVWNQEMTSARTIEREVNVEDFYILIDAAIPLGLVAFELIQNCLEHAFDSGSPPKPRVRIGLVKHGNQMDFTVSDNGGGFPDSFEPEESPGLGLLLVRNIVNNQMGGDVEYVRENPGLTVRVRFYLDYFRHRELGDHDNE